MEYIVKLKKREVVADETVAFTFSRPGSFFYTAGQFVNIGLIDPAYKDEKGPRRAMSLASYFKEEDLSLVMRLSDSAFKRSLMEIEIGEEIDLRGPFGHLTVPKGNQRPLVFIGGGIGTVPFRSMIADLQDQDFPTSITLFDFNRKKEDFAFYEELSSFEHSNYQYIPCVTGEEHTTYSSGEKGRFSEELLRKYVSEIEQPLYYIVGLNNMVKSVAQSLVNMGVPQNQIKIELYGQY